MCVRRFWRGWPGNFRLVGPVLVLLNLLLPKKKLLLFLQVLFNILIIVVHEQQNNKRLELTFGCSNSIRVPNSAASQKRIKLNLKSRKCVHKKVSRTDSVSHA